MHFHSGWLPEYQGSTTIYYCILQERRCGVTALLLDEGIDTGPVIARQHYPMPPADLDVDFIYDNAIRADLMVRVIRAFAEEKVLLGLEPQTTSGHTYFKIHPVLKHLAILSLQ